jgi:hypothetical protein
MTNEKYIYDTYKLTERQKEKGWQDEYKIRENLQSGTQEVWIERTNSWISEEYFIALGAPKYGWAQHFKNDDFMSAILSEWMVVVCSWDQLQHKKKWLETQKAQATNQQLKDTSEDKVQAEITITQNSKGEFGIPVVKISKDGA